MAQAKPRSSSDRRFAEKPGGIGIAVGAIALDVQRPGAVLDEIPAVDDRNGNERAVSRRSHQPLGRIL